MPGSRLHLGCGAVEAGQSWPSPFRSSGMSLVWGRHVSCHVSSDRRLSWTAETRRLLGLSWISLLRTHFRLYKWLIVSPQMRESEITLPQSCETYSADFFHVACRERKGRMPVGCTQIIPSLVQTMGWMQSLGLWITSCTGILLLMQTYTASVPLWLYVCDTLRCFHFCDFHSERQEVYAVISVEQAVRTYRQERWRETLCKVQSLTSLF